MEIIRRRRGRFGYETMGNRVLAGLLTPFFGCRCSVPEHIAALEEPVVFVSNHYEIFGPLAMAISLPLKFRLWANSIIVDPRSHVEEMVPGAQRALPLLTEGGVRRLLNAITPLWEKAIRRFEPIMVHKQDVGQQRGCIRRTVEAMKKGESIVLFPETAIPHYSDGSVTDFHRSFALIGEYYRRQTGQMAAFCPVYVDKRKRRIVFGEVVRYGQQDAVSECERISQAMRGQILQMAEAAHPGITAQQ